MPRMTNPTGRNTKAHVVEVGENEYFFSHETCVAFRGKALDGRHVQVRLENSWGPTTGRHFKRARLRQLSDRDR